MLIYFYGENTFLSRRKLKEVKDKYRREVDPSGASLSVLDGENASLAEISAQVGPASLFAKKRLVVVENIFLNKQENLFSELADFLRGKESGESNILVFWDGPVAKGKLNKSQSQLFAFLIKQKFVQYCKPFSQAETIAWIKGETASRGALIGPKAALSLALLTNGNLWQISQEIDKLLHYHLGSEQKIVPDAPGPEITVAEVSRLVRGQTDDNIFALTNALGAGQKALSFQILNDLRDAGQADIYILTMVLWQFKNLLRVKDGLEQGLSFKKIASLTKLSPFIAQKGVSQARNFPLARLKKIFSELVRADFDSKTGRTEPRLALELLLASV